jgi:hypothetical protein
MLVAAPAVPLKSEIIVKSASMVPATIVSR